MTVDVMVYCYRNPDREATQRQYHRDERIEEMESLGSVLVTEGVLTRITRDDWLVRRSWDESGEGGNEGRRNQTYVM
jgi:hypothetical protein